MPLTPADVAGKLFTLRRFRGYDPDEVDGFLDEVEGELVRLLQDNNELRAMAARESDLPSWYLGSGRANQDGHDVRQGDGDTLTRQVTTEEGEQVALRTLLAAHRTAELLIGEARVEARQRIDQATRECEQLLAQARRRGEQADLAAAERTAATLAELEEIRRGFRSRLAELRSYEASYRARLRDLLEGELNALKALPVEPALPVELAAPTPGERAGGEP